jgi:pimeloyl-ACP methyl ester carboxylesterase
MTLAYTRSGNRNSAALVFLHGSAMGQWMWHDQIQHFADYDCYTVDLPGHGSSSHMAWQSVDHAADCAARLIADEIPDKPVYLVGLSLGAVIGLHLMTRHPQRIERAVLTGTFADAAPRWMMTLQGWVVSAMLSIPYGRQMFARSLHLPAEVMPFFEETMQALSMQSYRRITQQIAEYTPLDSLNTLTIPTLFVTGEKDVALNRQAVVRLAQQVPGAVGVYAPGVHHAWNGEAPALFNEMTRAWIEGWSLPNSLIPAVGMETMRT